MLNMDLFLTNISRGFQSFSCNGDFIVPNHQKFPLRETINCSSNFIHMNFDYSMILETGEPWFSDCRTYLPLLCDSIYQSSNPYKCTRKVRVGLLTALSNGYAFASLALTLAIAATSSLFSVAFVNSQNKVEVVDF